MDHVIVILEKVEVDEVERVEEDYTSLIYHSPAVEAANAALAQDTDTGVVIDEGSLARKRHKPKRNITWASDDKLVQVSYFEVQPGITLSRIVLKIHIHLLYHWSPVFLLFLFVSLFLVLFSRKKRVGRWVGNK